MIGNRTSRRATLRQLAYGSVAATMLGLTFTGVASAHGTLIGNGGSETEEAEEAVGEVMFAFAKAFASCGAAGATKLYTDDAEWLNAFGDWAQGREAVAAKLEEAFSAPDFTAGTSVGKPTGSVRLLRPDVAIGWTYQEIAGQRVIGTGAPVGLLRNHSLLVLTKEQGQWLIAAQMFMDEEPHREASATPVS